MPSVKKVPAPSAGPLRVCGAPLLAVFPTPSGPKPVTKDHPEGQKKGTDDRACYPADEDESHVGEDDAHRLPELEFHVARDAETAAQKAEEEKAELFGGEFQELPEDDCDGLHSSSSHKRQKTCSRAWLKSR